MGFGREAEFGRVGFRSGLGLGFRRSWTYRVEGTRIRGEEADDCRLGNAVADGTGLGQGVAGLETGVGDAVADGAGLGQGVAGLVVGVGDAVAEGAGLGQGLRG